MVDSAVEAVMMRRSGKFKGEGPSINMLLRSCDSCRISRALVTNTCLQLDPNCKSARDINMKFFTFTSLAVAVLSAFVQAIPATHRAVSPLPERNCLALPE